VELSFPIEVLNDIFVGEIEANYQHWKDVECRSEGPSLEDKSQWCADDIKFER